MLRSGHNFGNFRLELLELRQHLSADVRTIDGIANNLANPLWGSDGQPLLRLAAAQYADGKSAPAGATRASARAISNAVDAQGNVDLPNARNMSAFVYAWGQFIDHDLDLTNTTSEEFDVPIPTGDPYFDPAGTGTQVIPFTRSEYLAGTGVTGPRQQTTAITSYIDGSMVYGSDPATAASLRTFVGGQMKTSAGNLLPLVDGQFVAGDVRVEENPVLTAIQTLFVREHNRIAAKMAKDNPALTDEQIYQHTRQIIGGEIESITYNEFLPALLGPNAIAAYSGYKSNVNPGISTEFSTAAYRIGHTLVDDDIGFLDNNGNKTHDEVSLADAFFNPMILQQNGIDPVLKYLASTNTQEVDTKIVDSLRNFLFGPPGAGGMDLAALNIQRGRDHGLADYNSTRAALGLPRITSFAQITSDVTLQNQLQSIYGNVNSIDLWVGGLAEDHVKGSSVGPTFQRIIADQFTRVRDGDRFWYQRDLNAQDLRMVQSTDLVDLIARDSTITNVQDNVFFFNVQITGQVFNDIDGDHTPGRGEPGLGGKLLSLLDDSGAVVATTRTSMDGSYQFSNVALGQYKVATDLPLGWRFTTPPVALSITRGMKVDGVNFGERQINVTPPPAPQPPPAPPQGPHDHAPRMIDSLAI